MDRRGSETETRIVDVTDMETESGIGSGIGITEIGTAIEIGTEIGERGIETETGIATGIGEMRRTGIETGIAVGKRAVDGVVAVAMLVRPWMGYLVGPRCRLDVKAPTTVLESEGVARMTM